jgi:DNA-binding NarL/FixJ family response regulator
VSKVYALNGHNAQERAEGQSAAGAAGGVQRITGAVTAATEGAKRPVTSWFVLIDRQRLRRSWVVASLEEWKLGGRLTPLSSAAEIAPQLADGANRIDVVILSVGGATITDPPVAEDLRWLRTHLPQVPVVVLADREDPASMATALRVGVRGYLPTSIEPEVARHALALVLAGGSYAPPVALLAEEEESQTETPRPPRPCDLLAKLTPRQRQVLELLGQGRPNKVIAQRLAMWESTVMVHVRQIRRKLGAANRTEVALKLSELAAAPS